MQGFDLFLKRGNYEMKKNYNLFFIFLCNIYKIVDYYFTLNLK